MDLGQPDWFLLALVGALALLAGAGLGWAICYARLHGRLAVAREENAVLRERQSSLEEAGERMRLEMEALAGRIFQDATTAFRQQSQGDIQALLVPLQRQIGDFRQRLDQVHTAETDQVGQLKNKLDTIAKLNEQLSSEAHHLAMALKQDPQAQGAWGEMTFENLLQAAGFQPGVDYETQPVFEVEGQRLRPDFVLKVPAEREGESPRHLIVDSKVSLTDYERLCRLEGAGREAALRAHCDSIRGHIDELWDKGYHDISGLNALGRVFMFVPVESALAVALRAMPELQPYAAKRNVVLLSPSLALSVLTVVAGLWRAERQRQNVGEIMAQVGRMLDKLSDFVADLDKVGERLAQAEESLASARARLATGKGNVLNRARKIVKLGVSANKELPAPAEGEGDEEEEG